MRRLLRIPMERVGVLRQVPRSAAPAAGGALAWLCGAVLALAPAAGHGESLRDAASEALGSNTSRQAMSYDVAAAAAGIDQASAGYRPVVNFTSFYGLLDQNYRSNVMPGKLDNFTHPREFGLEIDQNLFNGFKTASSVDRARETYHSSREDFRGNDQNLLLDVVTAYLDVLRNSASVLLFHQEVATQGAQMRETEARIANAMATRTDYDRTAASLAKARADEIAARSRLATATAQYRLLVGHEPGALTLPALPLVDLPASLDVAVDTAHAEHPAILAAMHRSNAAAADVRAAKAEYMPSLDLQLQALRDYQPQSTSTTTQATTMAAMVKLTFPIYSGGLTSANVSHAHALAEKEAMTLDYRRKSVTEAVTAAFEQYQSNRALLKASMDSATSARRALAEVRAGVAIGERSSLELDVSNDTAMDAEVGLINARCDVLLAAYNLLSAMGRLSVDTISPGTEKLTSIVALAGVGSGAARRDGPMRLRGTADRVPADPVTTQSVGGRPQLRLAPADIYPANLPRGGVPSTSLSSTGGPALTLRGMPELAPPGVAD